MDHQPASAATTTAAKTTSLLRTEKSTIRAITTGGFAWAAGSSSKVSLHPGEQKKKVPALEACSSGPAALASAGSTSMPQIGSIASARRRAGSRRVGAASPCASSLALRRPSAPAARIRLSESSRKFPEVTTVSPSSRPETISTRRRRAGRSDRARHEDALALRHEDDPAGPGVEHRLLRDEEGRAELDGQLDVHEHVGAQHEAGVGGLEAHLEGPGRRRRTGAGRRSRTAASVRPAPGCVTVARVPGLKNSSSPSKASARTQTRPRSAIVNSSSRASKRLAERDVAREDEARGRGADLHE